MTHSIYTLGYSGWEPNQLYQEVKARVALLLDIRYSPHSKRPAWERSSMRAALGPLYRHEPALGNRNYNRDAPIELAAPEKAVAGVRSALTHGPVILMCGCKAHQGCHRTVAAEYLRAQFSCPIEHLYPQAKSKGTIPTWGDAGVYAPGIRAYWVEEVRLGCQSSLMRLQLICTEQGWDYGATLETLR